MSDSPNEEVLFSELIEPSPDTFEPLSRLLRKHHRYHRKRPNRKRPNRHKNKSRPWKDRRPLKKIKYRRPTIDLSIDTEDSSQSPNDVEIILGETRLFEDYPNFTGLAETIEQEQSPTTTTFSPAEGDSSDDLTTSTSNTVFSTSVAALLDLDSPSSQLAADFSNSLPLSELPTTTSTTTDTSSTSFNIPLLTSGATLDQTTIDSSSSSSTSTNKVVAAVLIGGFSATFCVFMAFLIISMTKHFRKRKRAAMMKKYTLDLENQFGGAIDGSNHANETVPVYENVKGVSRNLYSIGNNSINPAESAEPNSNNPQKLPPRIDGFYGSDLIDTYSITSGGSNEKDDREKIQSMNYQINTVLEYKPVYLPESKKTLSTWSHSPTIMTNGSRTTTTTATTYVPLQQSINLRYSQYSNPYISEKKNSSGSANSYYSVSAGSSSVSRASSSNTLVRLGKMVAGVSSSLSSSSTTVSSLVSSQRQQRERISTPLSPILENPPPELIFPSMSRWSSSKSQLFTVPTILRPHRRLELDSKTSTQSSENIEKINKIVNIQKINDEGSQSNEVYTSSQLYESGDCSIEEAENDFVTEKKVSSGLTASANSTSSKTSSSATGSISHNNGQGSSNNSLSEKTESSKNILEYYTQDQQIEPVTNNAENMTISKTIDEPTSQSSVDDDEIVVEPVSSLSGSQESISMPIAGANAVISYTPKLADEIKVKVGDFIQVEEAFKDGWAIGCNVRTGERGTFPLLILNP